MQWNLFFHNFPRERLGSTFTLKIRIGPKSRRVCRPLNISWSYWLAFCSSSKAFMASSIWYRASSASSLKRSCSRHASSLRRSCSMCAFSLRRSCSMRASSLSLSQSFACFMRSSLIHYSSDRICWRVGESLLPPVSVGCLLFLIFLRIFHRFLTKYFTQSGSRNSLPVPQ